MLRVINRQYNKATQRKQDVRPKWFSYEKCYNSCLQRISVKSDLHVLVDGTKDNHHFNLDYYDHLTEFDGGSDAKSFLFALNYIKQQNFDDEDIIYIVEDDYLHRTGWDDVLKDVFLSFNIDYVSLYDHPDKYFAPMYGSLQSQLLVSKLCHWRTTPSTCNTYAAKMKTLKKHWDTHVKYCLPEHTHDGYDHTKFTDLWSQGSNLVTPILGYSTHCENPFLSPIIDWSKI